MSREIKVGIFTVVGIIAFCVSVILLGGDRFFLTRQYDLIVRLPQVTGLGNGSVVSVTGVPVGNVKDIRFIDKSTDVEVVLTIEERMRSRITEGAKASVKTQGALGDKYIYIEPGPLDAPVLKDGAVIETDRTPDFLDLIASKGAEMGEIVEVIKEVRVLLQSVNKDNRAGKVMANFAEASAELTKFLGEGRETFKLLRQEAIVPLSSVMKKIDNGQGTMGALVNDPSLHNRINAFFGAQPRNNFLKPLIRDSIETNEKKK